MSQEKILSGESSDKSNENIVISSEGTSSVKNSNSGKTTPGSLLERIISITETGGFESIPEDFDDEDGDWRVIKSDNPFEILYLDYKICYQSKVGPLQWTKPSLEFEINRAAIDKKGVTKQSCVGVSLSSPGSATYCCWFKW